LRAFTGDFPQRLFEEIIRQAWNMAGSERHGQQPVLTKGLKKPLHNAEAG